MMRIRAKLTLRNDAMIAARERLELSQTQLAALAGVPLSVVCRFERLDYTMNNAENSAAAVADALDLRVCDILPAEMVGQKLISSRTAVAEMDAKALVASRAITRLMLPAASAPLEEAELSDALKRTIPRLPPILAEVLIRRWGLDGEAPRTLEETADLIGLTKERIRQLQTRGMEAVRVVMDSDIPADEKRERLSRILPNSEESMEAIDRLVPPVAHPARTP